MKTQDPKYDIENGRLVNAATREPIPEDEPIFILRAKDVNASPTLGAYIGYCRNREHKQAVIARGVAFTIFAAEHPERMKEPDTDTAVTSSGGFDPLENPGQASPL